MSSEGEIPQPQFSFLQRVRVVPAPRGLGHLMARERRIHAGREGHIGALEIGKYSHKPVYSVVLDATDTRPVEVAVLMENELALTL